MILSTAHDFAQAVPLEPFHLICLRCSQVDPPGRCVPHYEAETSGFKEEE